MKRLALAVPLVALIMSYGQPAFAQEMNAVIELTATQGATSFQIAEVMKGARVTLIITSDIADSLLVKGYNKRAVLVPGKQTNLTFTADKEGRFEFVLERQKKALGEIIVQ